MIGDEQMRCSWADNDEKMAKYHDEIWGKPEHDDQRLFAKLCLDLMQAGLSWRTILYKQEGFERAFDGFDIETIARYDEAKFDKLMQDAGIIRNRLKIRAIINNAQRTLEVQGEFGSFDAYIWGFTQGEVVKNQQKALEEIPASSALSDAVSKDLKKRGFKFVGTTIIYAYLQAIGIVNDHLTSCFCYEKYLEPETEIPAVEVVRLLKLFEEDNIRVHIDGGWGVDALLGEQTRKHSDLDISLQHRFVPKVRKILEDQGFKDVLRSDTSEYNFVLGNDQGHLIDIHSYTFDSEGNNIFGIAYEPRHLTGQGVINGYHIECPPPDVAVEFRLGYEPGEKDHHDVRVLCERFNIPLPEKFWRATEAQCLLIETERTLASLMVQ